MMKTKTAFSLLAIASLALSGVAFAGGKTFQATGQVIKVSDSMVVIQNSSQKWEITRDASTKVKGDLKIGDTATVTYIMKANIMQATAVDVKAMPAAAAATAAPSLKVAAPAAAAAEDPNAQKKEEPNAQKKEQPGATATPTP